jgi:uncharacterized protein YllA (UPF0747 family)
VYTSPRLSGADTAQSGLHRWGRELSYWLELKPVFDQHRVNYPMIVMRTSMTVLNNASEKKLEKLGLSVIDFFGNIDSGH